jgi:hypothetical protein
MTDDLVHDDAHVGFPHPQVLGAIHGDHLGGRDPREAAAGLRRAQVVVELGDQGDQRLRGDRPPVQVRVGRAAQRR